MRARVQGLVGVRYRSVGMSEPAAVEVRNALNDLVNQFSDPMSFLRELIQNSVDAGSEEIEVSVERDGGGASGVTIVRVDDWGQGMTRAIIDKRLTRLFSSAKDGDMTKIGKFGIGFVSVFALGPQAVCVDTGREGESWRVLFDEERRFKLLRRDEPVEGTKIRILKQTDQQEHDGIVARAGAVLTYWCKHVETDIRYQGELVRQPFAIANAIATVDADDGFSSIVVAHRPTPDAFAGFYNSGLTLIETEQAEPPEPEFAGIGFKASSPHLEHTLTRDKVIEDDGYERVMDQVRALIAGPLCDRVLALLGEAMADVQGDAHVPLLRATARHALMGHLGDARADTCVARSPAGVELTAKRLSARHKAGEVLVAANRSHLTDALEKLGHTVVLQPKLATQGEGIADLIAALSPGAPCVPVSMRYCMPTVEDTPGPEAQSLMAATRSLLRAQGLKVGDIGVGRFDYPESGIAQHVAVALPELGAVAESAKVVTLGRGFLSRTRAVAINLAHPTVQGLLALAQAEPEFSAYVLVKQFMLGHHLDPELDTGMLGTSVEARCRRLTP